MNITKSLKNGTLTVAVSGRVDSVTANELEKELLTSLDGVSELVFDLTGLNYISSAGLRVLFLTHKRMDDAMKLINVSPDIMEVLEVTGFADIYTIE